MDRGIINVLSSICIHLFMVKTIYIIFVLSVNKIDKVNEENVHTCMFSVKVDPLSETNDNFSFHLSVSPKIT